MGTPVIVSVDAVPVGGAATVADPKTGDKVYVVQPRSGTFIALSTVCPHAGCAVNPPKNGQLVCPCHDSRFDATTGSVLRGPARQGLTRYDVTRTGKRLEITRQTTP
ncbi:Rieske (2Fe-2S) protein [Streptomyces sp. NPDC091376]|uniref:Rieske (2Fe-2S) protein n=1 Tax=Streptomyces sp. NPDC091376 TaxID=3365994 RepID=UPI0038211761